jgi:hypothetical protein
VWLAGAGGWVALLVASGLHERAAGPEVAGRVPAAVATLHLAYGAGFWAGAVGQLRDALGRTA